MNRKQFIIVLVLLAVVGAAGLLTYQKQNRDRGSGNAALGKKLVPDFPLNGISQLHITQGTNQVHLGLKDDAWRVRERNDYPANFQEISEFLIKVRDMKVAQVEDVGESQLPRLGLAENVGTNPPTVVSFLDKEGKILRSLTLGKKHMRKSRGPSPMGMGMDDEGFPDGRWVKTGTGRAVALVSDPLSNVESRAEQWLSKDFFKIEKPRAIAVEYASETNSYRLARDTDNGEWKLDKAQPEEKVDASKTSSLNFALNSPSFTDVLLGKPEGYGLDKPTTITIETFDDFTYVIRAGLKTNDNYLISLSVDAQIATQRVATLDEKDKAKLDKEFADRRAKLQERLAEEKQLEKWAYLVSSWTLEPVMKDRSNWLADKKDDKKELSPEAASAVATAEAALHALTNSLPSASPSNINPAAADRTNSQSAPTVPPSLSPTNNPSSANSMPRPGQGLLGWDGLTQQENPLRASGTNTNAPASDAKLP